VSNSQKNVFPYIQHLLLLEVYNVIFSVVIIEPGPTCKYL